MNESTYPFILSLIFVLHNAEEYISFDRMSKIIPMKKWSFLFSIALLSALVVLFAASEVFAGANIVVLFALLINSLQHCLLSIWHKKMVAGIYTALFLMLPFSVFYFIRLCELGIINYGNFLAYLAVSPVIMVISIVGTLRLGDYLFSNEG